MGLPSRVKKYIIITLLLLLSLLLLLLLLLLLIIIVIVLIQSCPGQTRLAITSLSSPARNTVTSSRAGFGLFQKTLKQENNLISWCKDIPVGKFAVITFKKLGFGFFSLTFSNESS